LAQDRTKDRIEKLYQQYLSGEISRKEYDELFDLLKNKVSQPWLEGMIDNSLPKYLEGMDPVHELQLISPKADHSVPHKMSRRKYLYIISAAAAVLILIAAIFFIFPSKSPEWVVHTTGYQETRTVELPDGSTVVLNANSELRFLEGFEDTPRRTVQFSGEGYFDVAHWEGKGFTVQTASIDVNVLGTEFNLETRRDYTNVFLKEGKVVLETQDAQSVEMEPGDLVHYDTENKQVRKVSDQPSDSALSWREGVFTFLELTGIQILEKMEDIYGKEFVIENPRQLRDVIVVQGLPYADWDFTKEALELALNIQIIDSTENKVIVKEK